MKNKIFSILVCISIAVPTVSSAFDYVDAVEKCVARKVKDYFVKEAQETKEFFLDGETRRGAQEAIREIREMGRDGIISADEMRLLIKTETESYQSFKSGVLLQFKSEMDLLDSTGGIPICIFKHYLKGRAYSDKSLLSRVFNKSTSNITADLIGLYGVDRYQQALALQWYCRRNNLSICYFNY